MATKNSNKKTININIFDRIPPTVIWGHNPDPTRTCQTQGDLYCTACGEWLGCTGMYGWRLKREELDEESKDVWVCHPLHANKEGRCMNCKVKIAGKGAINGGVNKKEWFDQ